MNHITLFSNFYLKNPSSSSSSSSSITTMSPLLTNTHHYHYLLPPSTSHNRHHNRHRHQPLITFSSVNRHHFTLFSSKRILLSPPIKSASVNEVSIHNNSESASNEFLDRIRKWVSFLPSIFPGGTWWNFSDDVEVSMFGQPVTVWYALGKMWNLVAKDRWVIFAAFSALIIAAVRSINLFYWIWLVLILWFFLMRLTLFAFVLFVQVSEISIPHFLTASIFSAQGGDIKVFHGNVRLLIILCVTSGICRSKSCMVNSPFYFFTLIFFSIS